MTHTAPTYKIKIHANPGIYGTDDQGNPWTTFSLIGKTIACTECGAQIESGYVRGKRGEEDLCLCCSHVQVEIEEMP